MKCPNCGGEVDASANNCPHCGATMDSILSAYAFKAVFIVVFLISAFGVEYLNSELELGWALSTRITLGATSIISLLIWIYTVREIYQNVAGGFKGILASILYLAVIGIIVFFICNFIGNKIIEFLASSR